MCAGPSISFHVNLGEGIDSDTAGGPVGDVLVAAKSPFWSLDSGLLFLFHFALDCEVPKRTCEARLESVNLHTSVNEHMYTYTHTYIYIYTYAYVYTYVYRYTRISMYVHLHKIYACLHTQFYACAYI